MVRGIAVISALSVSLMAQESDFGVSVPVTISGGALYTNRALFDDPNASPAAAAFRAVLYPTVRLGDHWFGYAAVQVRSTPYMYHDAFEAEHEVKTGILQAYAGYNFRKNGVSMVIKAGKLSSAFGSFPLRYDDAENPLLDQPLTYITYLPIRSDQLPCGTADLRRQKYLDVSFACGPQRDEAEGPAAVTLYGIPGIQAEVSTGRIDARLQLTNGSPAIPREFTDAPQYLQWTAGGGYTIHQGFRVGVSGFRGPYLDRSITADLPAGTTVRDFPATGLGLDAQWAKGRWSLNGELHRFRFSSPNFVVSPSLTAGYVEAKSVLTPRLYLAARAGFLNPGRVVDRDGVSADRFARYWRSYEAGAGWWISRNQLLKGSYEWLVRERISGTNGNIFGVQYVVQLRSLGWAK